MFQFKKFIIQQKRAAMKVSSDACLFGALIETNLAGSILDIGTGTGVLSLMLAQKNKEAQITAIEIEKEAFLDAKENFENSIFNNQLVVLNQSIQKYCFENSLKFDCIVSNPPFFVNSLKSENFNKNLARHNEMLNFDELLFAVEKLLGLSGSFWVIIPFEQQLIFSQKAKQQNLYIKKQIAIRHNPNKNPHRMIFEFTLNDDYDKLKDEIAIYEHDNVTYSKRYVELMSNYYTIF